MSLAVIIKIMCICLVDACSAFGTSVTPPGPILKALPKIFAHTDKTVRAEGTQLVHAFYQYIGPAIEPFLADLKPVQVKELKEAFEELEKEGKGKGSLRPERMTRAAAREAEANAAAGGGGDDASAVQGAWCGFTLHLNALTAFIEDVPDDPRMFAEEVDIVPKLPQDMARLTSSKWKERKEVLDELHALITGTQRIKEAGELGDLTKQLATCVQKDANVICVTAAAGCLEGLAKGIMTPFGRYRESVVPPMLERLKERKATVTDAIGNALDAIFTTVCTESTTVNCGFLLTLLSQTTLADIVPDILPSLSAKNPQVKEGALKFLARCLSTSPTPIPPAQVKPVSEALATLLEDSFEGARNEAATCLGILMKMVGERPLNAIMEGLADVRKAKVKEAFDKATVKAKAGGPAPRAPPPAAKEPTKKAPAPAKKAAAPKPSPAAPADDDVLASTENKPLKKPPARFMVSCVTVTLSVHSYSSDLRSGEESSRR